MASKWPEPFNRLAIYATDSENSSSIELGLLEDMTLYGSYKGVPQHEFDFIMKHRPNFLNLQTN